MNEQKVSNLINDYIELKKSQGFILYKSNSQLSLHAPDQLTINPQQLAAILQRGESTDAFISHRDSAFAFRILDYFHSPSDLLNIEFMHTGVYEQRLINKLRKYLYTEAVNYKNKYRWYRFISPRQHNLYQHYRVADPLDISIIRDTLQQIVSVNGNGGVRSHA